MKKIILFLILANFSFLYGQSDTTKVVTLQEFIISTIFHHVNRVQNLRIELYKISSTGLEKIENKNFQTIQFPTNSQLVNFVNEHHGIGPSVQFRISTFIEDVGEYEIRLALSSLGDFNSRNNVMRKRFIVKVGLPKLLSIGVLRNKYFLGENAEFNLAMSGLDKKEDYSYIILDSETKDTLKVEAGSPVVKLNGNFMNSCKERKIDLFLLHKNHLFNFQLPNGKILGSEFLDLISIVKPDLEVESSWSQNDTGFNPIVLENQNSLKLNFRYRGGEILGYFKYLDVNIMGRPIVDNSFEDDNIGLVSGLLEFDKMVQSGFNGKSILLKPTEKYYNNLEIGKEYKTKITIRFNTRCEPVFRTFTASIYK